MAKKYPEYVCPNCGKPSTSWLCGHCGKYTTKRPSCFKSNPSPQDMAENDCGTCPVECICLPGGVRKYLSEYTDEYIFGLVKEQLELARNKYPDKRNPLQSLNPVLQELYECKNELEYDEPRMEAAFKESIQMICVSVRSARAIARAMVNDENYAEKSRQALLKSYQKEK